MNNYNNDNQRRNQAAYDSLNNFTGDIANSAARGLNYANPVTLTKNLWNAAGQLPETLRKYDANYGRRVREDLYGTKQPTPMNTNHVKVDPPGTEMVHHQNVSRNNPQPTNAAPVMKSDPMHDVNLKKYDASTGMAFTPQDKAQHQRDQKLADVNRPSVYDGQQITPSNWHSPGKRYNDLDKSELLTEDGLRAYDDNGQQTGVPYFDNTYMQQRYGGSHRPRTEEQRIYEGKQAHNQRLRGIAALQNLNHYKRTGEDKQFAPQPGYDMQMYQTNPAAQQQVFENELAVRKHGLDIQKHNDSLHPETVKNKFKGQFSDIVDDNFNVTGQRFDGSYNEATGQWLPAGQDSAPPILDEDTFNRLSRAKELSGQSDKALTQYQQLLMELGLPLNWDSDHEE